MPMYLGAGRGSDAATIIVDRLITRSGCRNGEGATGVIPHLFVRPPARPPDASAPDPLSRPLSFRFFLPTRQDLSFGDTVYARC